jgi:hypothetical protein
VLQIGAPTVLQNTATFGKKKRKCQNLKIYGSILFCNLELCVVISNGRYFLTAIREMQVPYPISKNGTYVCFSREAEFEHLFLLWSFKKFIKHTDQQLTVVLNVFTTTTPILQFLKPTAPQNKEKLILQTKA